MGQAASCCRAKGPASVTKSSSSGKDVAVLCPSSSSHDPETTPTESISSLQQGPPPAVDPTIAACCLGAASQPGGSYDPTTSGPPLPGCEAERLEDSHLGELLECAPREELQNILSLVCAMFGVQNALVSLFFDRRVYIIDGTGKFAEGDFPWRYSMCGWTMASERHCVMIVNDVTQDARFCQSPVAKQYGVRFYVGAPLVSSSGHRIGTLCFADSKPRVFDDASLKLLCNFSELVTRALERDLLVAHQQQMAKPGEAIKHLEGKHRYRMLLRNINCVNSAVLLVDTGTTGWAVRYANSGYTDLVQRYMQSQATQSWVDAAAAADPSVSQPLVLPAGATTAAAAQAQGAGGDSGGVEGNQHLSAGVLEGAVGFLLFPVIMQQLAQEPDGGSSMLQQMQQLVASRQPFSLHGLRMHGFGDTTISLVFRSAGVSDLDGAVSICVPSWVPQTASVPTAAAALQAGAADKAAPSTACPPWQSLYFVTVSLESAEARALRLKPPGTQASTCGSFSVGTARSRGINAGSSSRSGITLSVPAAGEAQEGFGSCVYDEGLDVSSNTLSTFSTPGSSSAALSCGSNSQNLPASSVSTNITGPNGSSGANALSRSSSSCAASITSARAAAAALAVCRRIEGLRVGGLIAAGSYGRVYRGDYYGSTVAVKVLESDAVLRREAVTGLCLEALLGERLRHPNVVATLAWAVVTGKSKMAVGKRLWGESLDADRPSIAHNKAAIAAAAGAAQEQQQQQQPAAAAAGNALPSNSNSSSVRHSLDVCASVSQQLPTLSEGGQDAGSCAALAAAETWLVLEYCNKGCLQDAIDRGWLRADPQGPVSLVKVVVTAAEVAAGMYTLHKADIVHGDLSPYNVLLTGLEPAAAEAGRGFVAKISDFGLSRPMGGASKILTQTYGTITHQAPELLEHGVTSKAADVYSFGVLLWQMLASSRAWAGLSHHAVVHAVCVKRQQLQFPSEAPEALVALGQACMAAAPEDRPTFEDILEVLGACRSYVRSSTLC